MVRLSFALLTVSVLSASAVAQTTAATATTKTNDPLTLARAVQLAGANYPAIRAAELQHEAAREAIGIAKATYLPRADMLWQGTRGTTNRPNVAVIPQAIVPIPSPPAREVTGHSDWNTAVGVLFAWQPFDFGVRHAQVSSARFGAESAKRAADLTRLDVESAAAGAFLDLVAARQLVIVQQANVKRMEDIAHSIHVLVDNTLKPGVDASQADAQLAIARTQLIQAQTQTQVRLEALANLLQTPADGVTIDDSEILGPAPTDTAVDKPIESHPAVQEQGAILQQQEQQLKVLNRSWVPSFSLLGSVSGLGAGLSDSTPPVFQGGTTGLAPQTYNWMAGLEVTFPAFQFFSLRPQGKAQEAQVHSIEAGRQRLISDISAQVKQAHAMLDGARLIAENTPVELTAARQGEQQQRVRYQSGLATVVDISVAEAALVQAESDDAVARLNVWRGLVGVAEAEGDLNPFLRLLTHTQ